MVGEVIILYIFVIVDMNDTVERTNKIEIDFLKAEQKTIHTMFEQTAEALANAIDAKDPYTHGHSTRVAEYAKQIAILAGLSEKDCEEIYFAGLLHDVGKIGIPSSIINKDGKLTDEEFAEIKKHPVIGNQILSSITKSPYLSIAAHYHHERYDGRGYPEGLKGDDIPIIARIIAVADAYDAMTSKRSYRDPIPQQKVREEIVKGMDTQFDPKFATLMLHLIDLDTEYQMKEREAVKELAGRNNLICNNFRDAFSEGILLGRKITKIYMQCKPDEKALSPKSIPSFILFDSLDVRIHSTEKKIKEMLYLEYAQICFDGEVKNLALRDYKVEIQKNEAVEESAYKDRISYEVEAVKIKDHILLIIKNKFQTVRITLALPDSSRYSYLSLTGEHCSITEVDIKKETNEVTDDYIPRIAEAISYINVPAGDIPNVQIDNWRSDSSLAIPVTDRLEISFHSQSLPTARLIWHCPFISLFYSDDKKINGKNFREFSLIRIDGENWESDSFAQNKIQINKNEDFEGWDAWKAMNKAGIDCTITFRRLGNQIIVLTQNAGISIKSVTTLREETPEIYTAITGDQCAITNIRIKR